MHSSYRSVHARKEITFEARHVVGTGALFEVVQLVAKNQGSSTAARYEMRFVRPIRMVSWDVFGIMKEGRGVKVLKLGAVKDTAALRCFSTSCKRRRM